MPDETKKPAKLLTEGWLSFSALDALLLKNADAVEENNRAMLRLACYIAMILLLPLLAVSLLAGWRQLAPLYAVYGGLCVLMHGYYSYMRHRRPLSCSVRSLLYIFLIIVFSMACCLALFVNPRGTFSPLTALLISTPLILLDRPVRTMLFMAALNVGVGLCAYGRVSAAEALPLLVNNLCFTLVGLFLGWYSCQTRLLAIDARRQMDILSHTDSLTGLGNRRSLFERLAQLEDVASPLNLTGVMMVDVDDFKGYNDRYGHQKGDECLRAMGGLMERFSGSAGLTFYRYGGEEFLAVTTTLDARDLEAAAWRLVEAVRKAGFPYPAAESGLVTISVGYAAAVAGEGYEACISRADQALYAAKGQHKDAAVGAGAGERPAGYAPGLRERT